MVHHAAWVFDCDAPLDEFQRRMRDALAAQGWAVGPAQVYDLACARRGTRAFVKLAPHDWGVQVVVKVKPGWFGDAAEALRLLWTAGREAQMGVLGQGGPGATLARATPSGVPPGRGPPHGPA